VQVKNHADTVPGEWCETDPRFRAEVRNNGFTYAMPHPNVRGNPTVTYSAYIYPDGSLKGQSGAMGIITGRVTGTHMDGVISGAGCEYAVTADRS
jgi:hypothetical protein